MFEAGADTGDRPGELQYWVERNHLDKILPFPQAYHDLRMNRDGVLAVLTGMGTAKAAGSIMALGLDPRFDLRKAYWIVAGIAGVDPADASLGSAAWAEWVVDGDLGYEIDGREIPADWPTGFVPLGKSKPYEPPRTEDRGETYHLNATLADWAFHLTEHVDLGDTPEMQKDRAAYASANARRPPFVLKGDTISSSTFFTGVKMSEWANQWVKYHTGAQRQLRHHRDGGHRHSLFATDAGQSQPRGLESHHGPAYRQRLRSTPARHDRRGKSGPQHRTTIRRLPARARIRLARRQHRGPGNHDPLEQIQVTLHSVTPTQAAIVFQSGSSLERNCRPPL